ncbi:MAG: glycosyltransferase family 39 protein [Alphaproteobacteria bacterium]
MSQPLIRDRLWSPAAVAAAILLYLGLHFAARLAMAPTLGIDDAEQALFAQQFAWGYRFRQPPLFTWLLLQVFGLFGTNILSVSIVRYVLLAVCYGCFYLTARRCIADPRLAGLAVLSNALIYVFAFFSHHDLTHTTALAASIAATFYVFVRLADAPTLPNYVLLGLCLGVGMLSKWNFAILATALPLACLVLPAYRPLVLSIRTVAAVLAFAAVVSPSLAWLYANVGSFSALAVDITGARPAAGWASTVVQGSGELAAALVVFPQPFLLIFLAVFGATLWRGVKAPAAAAAPAVRAEFLGVVMLIAIALHWILVPTIGAVAFTERWMQPALMILPVFLFALVERGRPSNRAIAVYLGIVALFVAVAFGARIVRYAQGADYCGSCRALAPFAALSDQLRAAGLAPGTLVTDSFHVGGNLRVGFPDSRIVVPGFPAAVWPGPTDAGRCMAVWRADDPVDDRMPAAIAAYLADPLAGDPAAPHIAGSVEANMIGSQTRVLRLRYTVYDDPQGDCR